MRNNTGVAKLIILFFILIQFQVVFLLALYASRSHYYGGTIDLEMLISGSTLVLLIIAVLSIISVKGIFERFHEDIEQKIKATSMDNFNEIVAALKVQKHDFLNHLNSIYSLIVQSELEKAQQYIKGISSEVNDLGPPIDCDNIWISAVLQSKKSKAEAQHTNFEYEIRGRLESLPLSPWEISKVLGNLLDNALEAVVDLTAADRTVFVYVGEDSKYFLFRVCNSGQPISEEMLTKIFKKGFTTKFSGQGLGLSIVKSIAEAYGGHVKVKSREEITIFEVEIPKAR